MYVLGINTGRNTTAALIKDGEILAAAEEERFIREKGTSKFPVNAIKYCLDFEDLTLNEVDYIVFPYDFSIGLKQMFKVFLRYFPKTLRAAFIRIRKMFISANFMDLLSKDFGLSKKEIKKKVRTIEHHVAHAAVAYYVSGFTSAALLSIDGSGEASTTLLGRARGATITKLQETYFPYSVGLLYNTVTQFLGFRIDNGEGKVMGLAPYGNPAYQDRFNKIVWTEDKGRYRMDMSYFRYHYTADKKSPFYSKKFCKLFGPPREKESELTTRDNDLAATLQETTENIGVHLATYLHQLTGEKNLCVGGGVALNSVMNYKILETTPFEKIFVYPSSHDGGTAQGAALHLYFQLTGQPVKRPTASPYLGPSYTDEEIESSLKKFKLPYTRLDDEDELCKRSARAINRGQILGWYQGRMEIGPRALGNRSIVCAPYPDAMKETLNERVKHREGFRPFAPSAKVESYQEYFEINTPSPYMLLVCDTRREKLDKLGAITHVDGTARLQTVSRDMNPRYWALIDHYERLSGIPVILNTSFNVRGEPIVCSPEDAIKCYLSTHMDMLVLGNYITQKQTNT